MVEWFPDTLTLVDYCNSIMHQHSILPHMSLPENPFGRCNLVPSNLKRMNFTKWWSLSEQVWTELTLLPLLAIVCIFVSLLIGSQCEISRRTTKHQVTKIIQVFFLRIFPLFSTTYVCSTRCVAPCPILLLFHVWMFAQMPIVVARESKAHSSYLHHNNCSNCIS